MVVRMLPADDQQEAFFFATADTEVKRGALTVQKSMGRWLINGSILLWY